MIVLHTLGDALILVGDRKVRPSSPLVFASLLYLAMERGRRVPRAALQEMLFPDSDERSGSHSLRQLLYKLRQLGAPLESDATSVLLPADRVRDHTSQDGGAHPATVKCLPDYEPEISERFSEWLEVKRAEVAKDVRMKLASAIEAHREALNWSAVERDAQLLLSVDPFNEVGTFALAEAAALSGRKAAAIKMLSDYEKETGRTDLRLPASLLRRRIVQAVPEPVATLSALPFVGRDAEVKELRKYIARARAGQPCMYVIGGEAGIGKTRLLTETAALAALEGVSVFTVRCQAHYASRPLSVFIELVPALLAAPGALGISPQSLASLNSLTRHTEVQPERPPDSRDDITRSELLLAALRDLVDAVAAELPLLVAVEDAHWADSDSFRELNALVNSAANCSLIVVCTTRTPDSFPHSVITDDRTTVHRLKPLAVGVMGTLATQLLASHGGDSEGSLTEWSVRTSGGNPLFLQMLCSHYGATGEAFTVPPDVLSAVTRRVQQLPESERRILALCALLGKHATLAELRIILEWSQLQQLHSIQRLEDEGYLVLEEQSVRIAHDLVGQAALALVPPISRLVLHGCVATVLERRYELTNEAGLLWDCAEQWVLSGERDKAISSLTRCARHAVTIGRASDGIAHLSRAVLLASGPPQKAPLVGEMLMIAAMASLWEQAEAAAQQYEALNATRSQGQHTDVEIAMIDVDWQTSRDVSRAVRRALYCVKAADASTDHRVGVARVLLNISQELCDPELAEACFNQVRDLVDPYRAEYSHRLVPVFYHSIIGSQDVAFELLRVIAAELRHFSMHERMRAAYNACASLGFIGAYPHIVDLAIEHYEFAGTIGADSWRAVFSQMVCSGYVLLEDFDSAEKWFSIADVMGLRPNAGRHVSMHAANAIEICLGNGDADGAIRALVVAESVRIESTRWANYLKGLRERTNLLNPNYYCPDDVISELLSAYSKAKRFASCDGLVLALCESLARTNDLEKVRRLLEDYVLFRRERCPLPSSWGPLVDRFASPPQFHVARWATLTQADVPGPIRSKPASNDCAQALECWNGSLEHPRV